MTATIRLLCMVLSTWCWQMFVLRFMELHTWENRAFIVLTQSEAIWPERVLAHFILPLQLSVSSPYRDHVILPLHRLKPLIWQKSFCSNHDSSCHFQSKLQMISYWKINNLESSIMNILAVWITLHQKQQEHKIFGPDTDRDTRAEECSVRKQKSQKQWGNPT